MAEERSGITMPPELVLAPKPQSAAELPAHGETAAAPVAPASGSTGAVFDESPVVVVARRFWQSPTIKTIRNLVAGSLVYMIYRAGEIVVEHKGLVGVGIDWHAMRSMLLNVFIFNLALGIVAWRRTRDNNAVDLGLKKRPEPKP